MVRNINAQYGTIIKNWSDAFKIPVGVIVGFIATESGGKMVGPNKYQATGLMQVTPAAIFDSARKWDTEVKTPLPDSARRLLVSKIPNFFTTKNLSSVSASILRNLEKDANFNIMSGTLVLRWLIERFTDDSGVSKSLNKAMVAYNAGAYRVVLGGTKTGRETPVDSTSLATNRSVPLESRSYLYKMMGKDGFLELIYKFRAI
jgi:soluble lytic murein transglycosylase-like protein